MNDSITSAAIAPAITTVKHNASFNFRNWKQGQEGFKRLETLLTDGRITQDDITVTPAKDGDETATLYQRKQVKLELEVPLVSSFIKEDTLTPAQVDHLQALLNATIEKAQQPNVDAGKLAADDIIMWDAVLNAPYKQRTAAVKITQAMLDAAVKVFADYLEEVGSSPKGIALISNLCAKKFNLTACIKVSHAVMEKIQGRLVELITSLDLAELHQHEAVFNVWATAIEKVLKPEVEEEIDSDMI